MFRQVDFGEWSGPIAVIAFVVSAAVFLGIVVGILRLSRKKVKYLAELPLEKEKRQ